MFFLGVIIVPFGFERQLQRENEVFEQMQTNRNCVSVNVTFMPDGKLVPRSLTMDEREYKIDKVLNCRQGNSLKDSSAGFRYECVLRNKRFYLYFTGERWYLDF